MDDEKLPNESEKESIFSTIISGFGIRKTSQKLSIAEIASNSFEVILKIVGLGVALYFIGALVVVSLKNTLDNLFLLPVSLVLAIIVSVIYVQTETPIGKALAIFSIFLLLLLFFGFLSIPTSIKEPCLIGIYC